MDCTGVTIRHSDSTLPCFDKNTKNTLIPIFTLIGIIKNFKKIPFEPFLNEYNFPVHKFYYQPFIVLKPVRWT